MGRQVPVAAAAIAYGWWDTGVLPFTTSSYLLIAVPNVFVFGAYVAKGGLLRPSSTSAELEGDGKDATLRHPSAWWTLMVLAIILEVLGLALGGRSTIVPTLRTTFDRLLVNHFERELVFLAWLAVGLSPLMRNRRRRPERRA